MAGKAKFANQSTATDLPPMIKDTPKTTKSRWRRFVHGLMRTIRGALLLQDTPHRISLGCACGIFASPLPMLGQTVVGMILAKALGGNVVASLPWSWITNPFTTLPIFYGCYRVGMWVTPGEWKLVSFERVGEIVKHFNHLSVTDGFATGYAVVVDIFVPMLVGSILVGAIGAVIGYFLIRRTVAATQERRLQRLSQWRTSSERTPASDDVASQ
jgi:uncharacterized protein (DUF2062 family)